MMYTIEDLERVRPVDRERVEQIKQRMLDEVRAYRLRELRESLSLTQVQLAERTGVSQNRISRLEHGDIQRVQVDTLRKYVEAIGGQLRVEVLLGDQRIQLG